MIHSNAGLVLYMTTHSYSDRLLYIAVVLATLDQLWTPLRVRKYLKDGLALRRLVIWTCLAAVVLPLSICGANFNFIMLSWLQSATDTEGVSSRMVWWTYSLYIL